MQFHVMLSSLTIFTHSLCSRHKQHGLTGMLWVHLVGALEPVKQDFSTTRGGRRPTHSHIPVDRQEEHRMSPGTESVWYATVMMRNASLKSASYLCKERRARYHEPAATSSGAAGASGCVAPGLMTGLNIRSNNTDS